MQPENVLGGEEASGTRRHVIAIFKHKIPGQNVPPEQRIFNYRLSRARRVSENDFGILAAKFRVFQSPINSKPANIKKIIFASVALHNFLRANCKTYVNFEQLRREDTDRSNIIPGVWEGAPSGFQSIQGVGRGHSNDAKKVRDNLNDYFMSNGNVPWQDTMACTTNWQ